MSNPSPPKPAQAPSSPKLLDRVRETLRRKHYSYRTEQAYVHWIKRFILFHNKQHPKNMGPPEIEAFLTHLAVNEKVAASTQNQALQAILFLYRQVLGREITEPIHALRAKKPKRLPTVLTKKEVHAVLRHLSGVHLLIAQLLYGSGLRLSVQKAARNAAKEDVRTTMIYTHVLNRGAMAVRSPLD